MDKIREIMESAVRENNTVYTPVSTDKQPDQFGIYVSPKEIKHTFIGPFNTTTTKESEETTETQSGEVTTTRKKNGHQAAAIRLEHEGEYIGGEELLQWARNELNERKEKRTTQRKNY